MLSDRTRQPEKAAMGVMAVKGGTRSVPRDMHTSGVQPHLHPTRDGVGRNAADSNRSPSSSSSSSPRSRIVIPVALGNPRLRGDIPPSPSPSSSHPSKIAPTENFGSPRFQREVGIGSPGAQSGVPLGPTFKRRRTSTEPEPILDTARSCDEPVLSHAPPRTRPYYRTLETENPRALVGASDDEQCPPAGTRASYAGTHYECFQRLVGAPDKRFVHTGSQASGAGADTHCNAMYVNYRPSETDTRCGTTAGDCRRLAADMQSDTRAVGYRPSVTDTHRDAGVVGYPRLSVPPPVSTRAIIDASVLINSRGGGSQLVHSANRVSDSKRCAGHSDHAVNNRATHATTNAKGTTVRVGRERKGEVMTEELLSAAETSGDTHSDAGAVDYRSLAADTHSDTGVVGYRSLGIPPQNSTRINDDRRASAFCSGDVKRSDGHSAHPVNRASNSKRCDGKPAHPLNRAVDGKFATGTAVCAGRAVKVEVMAEQLPLAAETWDKEFSEQARSKSDARAPQSLKFTTDRTPSVRLR